MKLERRIIELYNYMLDHPEPTLKELSIFAGLSESRTKKVLYLLKLRKNINLRKVLKYNELSYSIDKKENEILDEKEDNLTSIRKFFKSNFNNIPYEKMLPEDIQKIYNIISLYKEEIFIP